LDAEFGYFINGEFDAHDGPMHLQPRLEVLVELRSAECLGQLHGHVVVY
jgi:hypothetical protein